MPDTLSPEQKQSALLRILRATLTLPAQVTLYSSTLGAIALAAGADLPPVLTTVAAGVGVNALSNILERIARGDDMSDEDIRAGVQAAIDQSGIDSFLTEEEFQQGVARLHEWQASLAYAVDQHEIAVTNRLAQLGREHAALVDELRQLATREQSDEIIALLQALVDQSGPQVSVQWTIAADIKDDMRTLATRPQEDELIELAKLQLERLAKMESLLTQHLPIQEPQAVQAEVPSLPSKAHQQLAQSKAELDQNPSDWRAWLNQAEAYYELEEMDKALVTINKAWELSGQDPRIASARGCILAEYAIAKGGLKSMLNEAISLFESLRGKTTEPAGIDYNIGNSYAGLNEHEKAVEHFDQALVADPSPELAAQIWKNRGTSYFYLGNEEEEIISYQKALELNPRLFEAYASWGAAELRHGRFQRARDLLERAFEVDAVREMSGYPQLYSLAYALWRLGELEEAHLRVNQVLALQPFHKDGLLLKAYLLSQLWRKDSQYVSHAIAFFENRVIDDPEDVAARNELHLIYNSNQYQHDARSVLEETALSSTAPLQSLYHYAMLLEDENRTLEALGYLETAFERSKEHHIVHALGRLKKKTGDYLSAIKFYELALKDVSDPVPILHSIADCYHLLGEYKNCVRVLASVILIDPRDEKSWTNLGYALAQLGEESLFDIFLYFLYKLRHEAHIADDEAEAAKGELLSRLRLKLGGEFVDSIQHYETESDQLS